MLGSTRLLVYSGGQHPLLSIRLDHLQIDYGKNVPAQLRAIWTTPEVAREAAASKIRIGPFNVSEMVVLEPKSSDQGKSDSSRVRRYDGSTVLEILSDALGARTGLVWIYDYVVCNDICSVVFDVSNGGR